MTLQDYINLTQDSINNFFNGLGPTLSNIVAAIVIFAIGLIIGSILKRVWEEISKAVSLERSLSGWDAYQKLTKAHDGVDLTSFVGELLRWLSVIVFLLPAIDALGIAGGQSVLSAVMGYLPNVVVASLFLVVGFVISWFIHRLVMVAGVLVDKNPSHLIADVAALAVIVFALLGALQQLGLGADLIRFFVLAGFAATALAFGLAGKDTAAELIKKFMDRAK
ncbi:MAG: hypothetical protein Q8P13_03615 [bacterium]|nr:hypothetical protein [bacterium]